MLLMVAICNSHLKDSDQGPGIKEQEGKQKL